MADEPAFDLVARQKQSRPRVSSQAIAATSRRMRKSPQGDVLEVPDGRADERRGFPGRPPSGEVICPNRKDRGNRGRRSEPTAWRWAELAFEFGLRIRAMTGRSFRRPGPGQEIAAVFALVDEMKQDLVDLRVAQSELVFIGLPVPRPAVGFFSRTRSGTSR